MREILSHLLAALCLGVLSMGAAYAAPIAAGRPAPSFVLKDSAGKPIKLSRDAMV
jgi:hypothetical protein